MLLYLVFDLSFDLDFENFDHVNILENVLSMFKIYENIIFALDLDDFDLDL